MPLVMTLRGHPVKFWMIAGPICTLVESGVVAADFITGAPIVGLTFSPFVFVYATISVVSWSRWFGANRKRAR